ncbi:hypothetical protein BDW02DRAFT_375 [Decorospora gaudefroyi]|uniref:Uncharacterized protein n=1 Tax=Decorospora gaudefroyi TaxID=184978 RepID=A0A6A5L040_9PLEO|nr:hypothetical protein BDW02DRAFT_375 [Decorospora gaudefroyi]
MRLSERIRRDTLPRTARVSLSTHHGKAGQCLACFRGASGAESRSKQTACKLGRLLFEDSGPDSMRHCSQRCLVLLGGDAMQLVRGNSVVEGRSNERVRDYEVMFIYGEWRTECAHALNDHRDRRRCFLPPDAAFARVTHPATAHHSHHPPPCA